MHGKTCSTERSTAHLTVSGRQSSRVTKVPLVAQGVQVHGVAGVRHEEEKEEGEVEQEIECEKEENNTQGRRHMCMDGMKVKRQMRSALSP